jgi:hypothetical protein
MTTERWRQYDPADGDVDWRAIRDGGAVVAGLVKLGRSTLVYTYDARLAELDGARFASAKAARGAVQAALVASNRPADRPGVGASAPIPFRPAARDSRVKAQRSGRRPIAAGPCFPNG